MNIRMTKKQIELLKMQESLEGVIDDWWEENHDEFDFPVIGEDVISIMASSAINILLAIHSTREVLKRDGFAYKT